MNLVDFNQRIPAGLLKDGSGEFYISENEICLSYMGEQHSFENFPEKVVTLIENEMSSLPEAMDCLVNDFGLLDIRSQMRQFLACRHGGFDCSPDISTEGVLSSSEYVDCGRRGGLCKSEGKLCSSILLQQGKLSANEIATLTDIALGLLDKEIEAKRGFSVHTIRNHKDSIAKKAGLSDNAKPALVGLAYKLRLVNID